jgi:hypothetical protein
VPALGRSAVHVDIAIRASASLSQTNTLKFFPSLNLGSARGRLIRDVIALSNSDAIPMRSAGLFGQA